MSGPKRRECRPRSREEIAVAEFVKAHKTGDAAEMRAALDRLRAAGVTRASEMVRADRAS